MKPVVITYIFEPNYQTQKMVESVERQGLPLVNMCQNAHFGGHGETLRIMHRTMQNLRGQYTHVIFSDGGDTYFLYPPNIPIDHMVYSTEKACYPHPHKAQYYPNKYTPWCFLNGGGWAGPIDICIEFFERYGLSTQSGDINGQDEIMEAYFKAKADDFPIEIDQMCEIFQTTAFEDPGDFQAEGKLIKNLKTNTYPAILHGNGRTPMDWIYNLQTI